MTAKNNIMSLRKEAGLSRQELGEKIDVSDNMIGKYERGDFEPKPLYIKELARFFGVSEEYLMGESNFRNEKELKSVATSNSLYNAIKLREIDAEGKLPLEEKIELFTTQLSAMMKQYSSNMDSENFNIIFKLISELFITLSYIKDKDTLEEISSIISYTSLIDEVSTKRYRGTQTTFPEFLKNFMDEAVTYYEKRKKD